MSTTVSFIARQRAFQRLSQSGAEESESGAPAAPGPQFGDVVTFTFQLCRNPPGNLKLGSVFKRTGLNVSVYNGQI